MKKRLKCFTCFGDSNYTGTPITEDDKRIHIVTSFWDKYIFLYIFSSYLFRGRGIAPRIVGAVMDIFNPRCIYNFLPGNWRAFHPSHYKTKLSHCTVILRTTIESHSSILNPIQSPNGMWVYLLGVSLCSCLLPYGPTYRHHLVWKLEAVRSSKCSSIDPLIL